MALDFLNALFASVQAKLIIPGLTHTPFDELLVIDLKTGQYEFRYHTDGKFFVPVNGGVYQALMDYASANLFHPEDVERQKAFTNPADMKERLNRSNPMGILTERFRFLALNGEWRQMEILLISGPEFGLADNIVYLYMYDVEEIRNREEGQYADAALPSQHLLNQMPDQMPESVFFTYVQERLSRPAEGRWCLIAVDIKHFKLFKELNGQENGEQLLIRFAETLHKAAQETGGVSCYRGQDDFALFLPYDSHRIDRLFADLCRAIDTLSGVSGFFPIFGISVIDAENGDTALDLFNQAALTAEEIKDDLQYHIRVYDPKVHERHVEEFKLLTEFQDALKNGNITFYLQPQCRVADGRIIGAESLSRWRREDGSYISPVFFIPVLEKYGVVTDLDLHIWDSVCAWLRSVIDRGIRPVPISVNVSRIDMFSMDVAETLSSLLKKYSLPAELLKVEITESAYVDDSEQIKSAIASLRAGGFQVLMDDFGSGYSSLNMLRSTSMDVIKLDAQFLHFSAGEEQKGMNILESVINMTKSLSTPIIVEGVDTKELVLYLTDMGCRYMQGFYFYRPMPGEQFEKLLKNPDRIDYGGIRQPIHEQMHIREFMDDSIYSDAMLNNILGPVAFYALRDRNVDITRFNQQFFRLLGIEPEVLEERRYGIQEFFHPDDRDKFFDMLEEAKRNRISGNSGFFRIFKPDGSLVWLEVQAYYLREQDGASLFYGSVRDRTEMLYVNNDLPGGYFRCTPKDGFRFLYVSEGFRSLFGYTGDELKIRFDSKLINMIHPDDRDRVQRESDALAAAKRERIAPYRIRNADGEYRYVIDQSRYTETFGEPCFQTVLIDVTEVMTLRNRMRLLEKYATDCILFLRDLQDSSTMEMVVYGLKNAVGIDGDSFLRQLRNQEIRITSMQGDSLDTQIMKYREDLTRANGLYTLRIPDGKEIRVHVRFSLIPDGEEETVCIVTLTPATV